MWLASYLTHRHKLHRSKCADRSYYHFLDGELWSNHLSWQWVQSTFSHKPYFMNEENLTRYGRFTDVVYRGEYDDIASRIFDPKRWTDVRNSPDIHHTLATDLSCVKTSPSPSFSRGGSNDYDWYTILTPRDLHPSKITDPTQTVCVLDIQFLTRHPRSAKRIQFVQSYCDMYGITLVTWDIGQIIQNSSHITIYQTRNPFYRQAYEQASIRSDVSHHPHQWCSPAVAKWYNKKFFPFWEKTKPYLYQLQDSIV
jgi:deoxyribodipyrimidine photo-lyase